MINRGFGYEEKRIKQAHMTIEKPDSKAARILLMFEKGQTPMEIAKLLNFEDARIMGEYMRNKGYKWDAAKGTYIPYVFDRETPQEPEQKSIINSPTSILPSPELLELLEKNIDKLIDIISEDVLQVPRYIMPGISRTKSFHMNYGLEQLVKEFCTEKNMSQKDFLEVALIEGLKRYGYKNEVARLNRH